jgi:hypothetical protein
VRNKRQPQRRRPAPAQGEVVVGDEVDDAEDAIEAVVATVAVPAAPAPATTQRRPDAGGQRRRRDGGR